MKRDAATAELSREELEAEVAALRSENAQLRTAPLPPLNPLPPLAPLPTFDPLDAHRDQPVVEQQFGARLHVARQTEVDHPDLVRVAGRLR